LDIQELKEVFALETSWGLDAVTELETDERTALLIQLLPLLTPIDYTDEDNALGVALLGNDWASMNSIFDQYLDATHFNQRPDNFSEETFIRSGLVLDKSGELASALLSAGGLRLALQDEHKIAWSEIV
jgi:hypothetical protein